MPQVIVIKEKHHKKKGGAKKKKHHPHHRKHMMHGDGFLDTIGKIKNWAQENKPLGRISAAVNAAGLAPIISSNPIGSALLKGIDIGAKAGYGSRARSNVKKRAHRKVKTHVVRI